MISLMITFCALDGSAIRRVNSRATANEVNNFMWRTPLCRGLATRTKGLLRLWVAPRWEGNPARSEYWQAGAGIAQFSGTPGQVKSRGLRRLPRPKCYWKFGAGLPMDGKEHAAMVSSFGPLVEKLKQDINDGKATDRKSTRLNSS